MNYPAYPPYGPPHQPPQRQVTRERRRTSHGLHLALTICTFGLWGIVWLFLTVWHKIGPRKRSVTTWQ